LICEALAGVATVPECVYRFFAPEIVGQILASGLGSPEGIILVVSRGDIYKINWDERLSAQLVPILELLLNNNWPMIDTRSFINDNSGSLRALAYFSIAQQSLRNKEDEKAKTSIEKG